MKSVFDPEFSVYGKVVEGYDFTQLMDVLVESSDRPTDRTIYVPSAKELEALDVFETLQNNMYGGMPIQIGYCNGFNTRLNCLEYHRNSEVNIMVDDIVFLVARLQDIEAGQLSTDKVEAFAAPTGAAVQLYETTLHYAPAHATEPFRVAVVLPRGTNTDKPTQTPVNKEDQLLWAKNKWLLAHPDTQEAKNGAFVGLGGANIDISK